MKKLILLVALMVPLIFVQTAGATTSNLNLVVNGGFEDYHIDPAYHPDPSGPLPLPTGWDFNPASSGSYLFLGGEHDTFTPHSGSYAAFFGGTVDDTITQSITTVAGGSYTFNFWLRHYCNPTDTTDTNSFHVIWDGAVVPNPLKNTGFFDWTKYTFTVTATTDKTEIGFAGLDNTYFYGVDDVSVTATPIPGAVWLLGSGLLGLAFLSRKKIFNG